MELPHIPLSHKLLETGNEDEDVLYASKHPKAYFLRAAGICSKRTYLFASSLASPVLKSKNSK